MPNEKTKRNPRLFQLSKNLLLIKISLVIILHSSDPSVALMTLLPPDNYGHRLQHPVTDITFCNSQECGGASCHPYRGKVHRPPSSFRTRNHNYFGLMISRKLLFRNQAVTTDAYNWDNDTHHNIGSENNVSNKEKNQNPTTINRCSSRDAATLIKNATNPHSLSPTITSEDNHPLLVITCDASGRGGGSKHDGIASVLRMICGVSWLFSNSNAIIGGNHHDKTDTDKLTSNGNVGFIPSMKYHDRLQSEDLIDTIARRTVPARKSSEVAAISLGIRRALQVVPPKLRKRVLILSDSEFALDFFCSCGEDGGSGSGREKIKSSNFSRSFPSGMNRENSGKMARKRKRKGTTSTKVKHQKVTPGMAIREEANRRSLHMLMKDDATISVFFAKIKSSSRGAGMILSTVNNNGDSNDVDDEETLSWDGSGFIDHDAADYLSSATRSLSNNDNNNKDKITSPNRLDHCFQFRAVSSLSDDDLDWLANSESSPRLQIHKEERHDSDIVSVGGSELWRTMNVLGSNARNDRLKRNKRRKERISDVLGLE